MAERYAVTTGLWEAATFNGGTLPGVGDTVHPNGYTVTIDRDIAVGALSNRVGSVASAGGIFSLTSSSTVTADIYGGTSTCLSISGNTLATLVGNLYGSNTTGSAYAAHSVVSGTLTIRGNITGGTVTSAMCLNITGSGNIIVEGNATGGMDAGGYNHGIRYAASAGTLTVYGNAIGAPSGGATNTAGISNGSTTGAIYLRGNAIADIGPGVSSSTASHVYVYGDAIGGTTYTVAGVWISGSSTGNIYVYGTARSSATGLGPGAYNTSSGSACVLIQAAETGAGGGWPVFGKVLFNDLSNIAFGVRNAAGTLKTIGVLPHSPFSTPRAFT